MDAVFFFCYMKQTCSVRTDFNSIDDWMALLIHAKHIFRSERESDLAARSIRELLEALLVPVQNHLMT